MSYTPEQTLIARPLVLGWAAILAYAQPVSQVVQRGLLLMFQREYNAPAFQTWVRTAGGRTARITEDGTWGQQSAAAVCVTLAAAASQASPSQGMANLGRAGVLGAFGLDTAGEPINTLAKLRSRFTTLRDSMQVASDNVHGVFDGVAPRATSLFDLVRNAPTTADVGGRAQTYLATLGEDGAPSSAAPATTVVSTRTPPSTKFLNEATQTPSTTPDVIAPVLIEFDDGANVPGRTFPHRANLAIIIPSVLVGGAFLLWGVQKYQKRARR